LQAQQLLDFAKLELRARHTHTRANPK
jgi:hypothetical protein